jgi:hypothetical protein
MVDFTDLDINKLERLQIEGKLTEEELKEAIRVLAIKSFESVGTEEVYYWDDLGNLVKKPLDIGQKKRKILAQKAIAKMDFDKTPEEEKADEEFSKFEKLH